MKQLVDKALALNANAPEANVNKGLLSMLDGNTAEATQYLSKGSNALGLNEALGNLYLLQGNNAQAVKAFGKDASNSAALAQVLHFGHITNTVQHSCRHEPFDCFFKIPCSAAFTDSAVHKFFVRFCKLRNDAAFKQITQLK